MTRFRSLHSWRLVLLGLAPLLFLILFFFFPLANIIGLGLFGEPLLPDAGRGFPVAAGRLLAFTLWQAALSTLLTVMAGLPAAYLLARFEFPGRDWVRALATVPFVLPTVVVAAAFRALLGPSGPINALLVDLFQLTAPPLKIDQTLTIVLAAHVFYNLAIVIRLVGSFWARLDPQLAQAAQLLGASSWRRFWSVTMPLLRPALLGATLLIFLFTFTSFGVIIILGGPAIRTLETEIFRQYTRNLRPDVAAVLSLIQIGITFTTMVLYARWQDRAAVPLDFQPEARVRHRPRGRRERIVVWTLLIGLLIIVSAPLLALLMQSLSDGTGDWTIQAYRALAQPTADRIRAVPPLQAVRNSLVFGFLTAGLATGFGATAALGLVRAGRARRWLDALLMLPLGASAVTLGFGYTTAWPGLRTSPLLVLIAHTVVAIPFVFRSVMPILSGMQPTWREAAALLGATPLRVFRHVDLPIASRALAVGAVFAFTVSLGEFGATSFIARPDSYFTTMPLVIETFLRPGALNYRQALALSTILMAVCVAGFVAIERIRLADIGEF